MPPGLTRALVVMAATVANLPAMTSAAPTKARAAPLNVLIFAGALRGTVHLSPITGCLPATPRGAVLQFTGQLRGWRPSDWALQVVAPRDGTYAMPDGENAGVVLTANPVYHVWGVGSSGSFSVHGAGGRLAVALWDADGGKVTITGRWACKLPRAPAALPGKR